ncbi:MAG: GNAT family N-acetyltransferase [Candidatus Cloacimonetes bacterium]|nr:GNAT family N-acetyltransferase [Candidatus Cloacimonadota bacterium]MCF7814130.1 GNAT family N-acetyltransferase [Candidatus Cloacimonadota bacterium]MCF7868721.1 GNAT family N-acetyltransferase [Candidatus Cloacimonadota bacterium]MCF7884129.1 GNAT family N-acetyltransferase [Candidatus Cloacimonadota bacterium]
MDLKDLIYREILPADIPKLLDLWRISGLSIRPKGRDRIEKIAKELENDFEALIGAFQKEDLVAFILATHDGRKGWINRLAVHPDFRRKGLATKMIKQAEKFLESNQIEIYTCLIEDWNKGSIKLFSDLGYKRHDDIIYFSKRLNPDV